MSRVVAARIPPAVACVALPSSAQEPDAASYDCTWTASLQGHDGSRRTVVPFAVWGESQGRRARTFPFSCSLRASRCSMAAPTSA